MAILHLNGQFVVAMTVTESHVQQALSLVHDLQHHADGDVRICVAPLEELTYESKRRFRNLDVELTEAIPLRTSLRLSGYKLEIPAVVEAECYLLLDTDHRILSETFLTDLSSEQSAFMMVEEDELYWRHFAAHHPQVEQDIRARKSTWLMSTKVLQTGLIYITRSAWHSIYGEFKEVSSFARIYSGDMLIVNEIARQSERFKALSPNHSLVLRPSGRGLSTKWHIQHCSLLSNKIRYKECDVRSIHHTRSEGAILPIEKIRETIRAVSKYVCPICCNTEFERFRSRSHARCSSCRSLERHRQQFLVLKRVLKGQWRGSVLHAAPEPSIAKVLREVASDYVSFDLMPHRSPMILTDIQCLPFPEDTFSLAFVSHVLEHTINPMAAAMELRRVLAPDGLLVNDVPIERETTVAINPSRHRDNHRWSLGVDFLGAMSKIFGNESRFYSSDFSPAFNIERASPVTVYRK